MIRTTRIEPRDCSRWYWFTRYARWLAHGLPRGRNPYWDPH